MRILGERVSADRWCGLRSREVRPLAEIGAAEDRRAVWSCQHKTEKECSDVKRSRRTRKRSDECVPS